MRTLSALIGTLAVAAGIAACGDTTTTTTSASSTAGGSTTSAAASGGGPTITAQDFSFSPSTITVKAGQTVTITLKNTGQIKHNFTADAGSTGSTANVDLDPGSTQTLSFTAPTAAGTVSFHCAFHPTQMTGTITVTP